MTVGENLKKIRNDKELTQKELGDMLHVSNKTISKWESNRSLPDIDTIKNIAKVFDVDYKFLIDGNQEADFVETESKHEKRWMTSLMSIVVLLSIVIGNYLFGKLYVIYDLHFFTLLIFIVVSSIVLGTICRKLKYNKNIVGILFLLVSSLNIFLLITTVFTSEEVYIELIAFLAVYLLIVSGISYYVFKKLKSKISLVFLFSIYVILKLLIPLAVLFGIGMSSYGNI